MRKITERVKLFSEIFREAETITNDETDSYLDWAANNVFYCQPDTAATFFPVAYIGNKRDVDPKKGLGILLMFSDEEIPAAFRDDHNACLLKKPALLLLSHVNDFTPFDLALKFLKGIRAAYLDSTSSLTTWKYILNILDDACEYKNVSDCWGQAVQREYEWLVTQRVSNLTFTHNDCFECSCEYDQSLDTLFGPAPTERAKEERMAYVAMRAHFFLAQCSNTPLPQNLDEVYRTIITAYEHRTQSKIAYV